MSFATVTIVGRLGGDPESRYLQNGQLVVNFSMAADGRKKGDTTWFRVSCFGEQAERVANMVERGYIAKGRMLYVAGRFEAREYQANGQSRTSLDVVMSDWQFVGSGERQGESQQAESMDEAPF